MQISRHYRRATLALAATAIALPAMTSVGCATRKQLRTAMAEREALRQEAKQNEAVAYSARAEAQVYRAQLKAGARDAQAKDEAIATLTQQMVEMQSELDSVNASYTEAVERAENPLPPELARELKTFADANSELMAYDAQSGMVRFKSDVTFGVGSAELTPQAKAAVKRLASIFNSGSARGMDLMIAGHTDSKPVSRSSTIKKGHKDNWYLSSHRAIAVSETLREAGISSGRVAVVGYADQRPTTTNATAAGRAANRRVELILLPSTGRFASGTFADSAADGTGNSWTEAAFDWLNTDSTKTAQQPTARTPQGPIFDK